MKINMVLEGGLEEPVANKLVTFSGHEPGTVHRLNGAPDVKRKAYRFHPMTTYGEAVLVLSDYMDTKTQCILQAKHDYLLKHIPRPNPAFILRFAVNELESWLLADRVGLSEFLKIPINKIPINSEHLHDPKQNVVNLARMSKSSTIRDRMVPESGHGGPVGPDYNGTMTKFVETTWNLERAQINNISLRRCIAALQRL